MYCAYSNTRLNTLTNFKVNIVLLIVTVHRYLWELYVAIIYSPNKKVQVLLLTIECS